MNKISLLLDKIFAVVNPVFKFAILVCIAIFLFIYYRSTEINRYQYIKSNDNSSFAFNIFDTKTGLIHLFVVSDKDKNLPANWAVVDPVSGTSTVKEHKVNK